MKKNISFKKLSMILASGFLFAVTSCTFATRANLKEMTEEAEVIGTNIEELRKQGLCEKIGDKYYVPSDKQFVLTLSIANPQNFYFNQCNTTKCFGYKDIKVSPVGYNAISITYDTTYLANHEKSNGQIQPGGFSSLTITERDNSDKEIKDYKCDFVLECNSHPDSVSNLNTFYTTDSKNVLIFDMPVAPNDFADSTKNGDIKQLVISAYNAEKKSEAPITNTYTLSKTGNKLPDDNGNYYYDFSNNTLVSLSRYTFTELVKKLSDKSYTDSDKNNWSSNSSTTIIFFTNDDREKTQITYEVILKDDVGLASEKATAQTKEYPRLPAIEAIFNNGAQIADNTSISQDDNSYTASVSFKIPDYIYYLGKTVGESTEAKTTYYDEISKKQFEIYVDSNGDSINSTDQDVLTRYSEWKNGNDNGFAPISESMPSEAEISYSYTVNGVSADSFKGSVAKDTSIELPPGEIEITATIKCSSAVSERNFDTYLEGSSTTTTFTINANKLPVQNKTSPEYGTKDNPYHLITTAVAALSDLKDSSNTIDVTGKLTENISLPNTSTDKYSVTINAKYDDTLEGSADHYPIITHPDDEENVLTIGDNYVVTINNFTFIGDISIGNNSKVTFKDCVIGDINTENYSGKMTIGEGSTVTIIKGTTSSRNTIISDITYNNGSTLSIENGILTGKIKTDEKATVAISSSTVTGDIAIGNSSKLSIKDCTSVESNITSGESSSVTITKSTVTGDITTGKSTNKGTVLEITDTTLNGNITVDENSTAKITNSSIKSKTITNDEGEEVAVSGNVSIGKYKSTPSVLVLDGKNVVIDGVVTLADPILKENRSVENDGYCYIELAYSYKNTNNISITMNTPMADLPVIQNGANASYSYYTTLIQYFTFNVSGYSLQWKEGSNNTWITLKQSGVSIKLPVTDGFTIKLDGIEESDSVYTAKTDGTIKASIYNQNINSDENEVNVDSCKMELYSNNKLIAESKENTLTLTGKNIHAGTYELVITFVYNGMTFSNPEPYLLNITE